MNTFDRAHLALLRELEGFDDSALDSYFEVTPDGEYAEGQEQQYMEVQSSAPQAHYMGKCWSKPRGGSGTK